MKRGTSRAILAILLMGATLVAGAKRKQANGDEAIAVNKRIEPFYPNWAYNNGIGEGFAKIAFYVDENGNAFKQAAFERPMVNGKPTIAFLQKTYLISVTVE